MAIPCTKLGSQGFKVPAQGFGCMCMSAFHATPVLHHAVDSGVTFLDTSESINEFLLGKALKGMRHKVQLATKFGVNYENGKFVGDVRQACEASLQRLDVDYIDLYYLHRVDIKVPIEVTVGEMKKLVEEGKVKYIGLSQASASTIRRAHAVHPITAVQLEWSLWSQGFEKDVIPTCRELGIGIVACGPVGRGFLTVAENILKGTTETDYRKTAQPRLEGENLKNIEKLYAFQEFASRKGCTLGQLALAWVHHQGNDVVPIAGSTRVKNFEENVGALQVKLKREEMEQIEALFHSDAVAGDQYGHMNLWSFVNAETPPLSSWKAS